LIKFFPTTPVVDQRETDWFEAQASAIKSPKSKMKALNNQYKMSNKLYVLRGRPEGCHSRLSLCR